MSRSVQMKAEQEQSREVSLLDLPELALECILERLPPAGLFNMASVCTLLRKRCSGDFLWEKHMKQKWGGLISGAARRESKMHISWRKALSNARRGKPRGLMKALFNHWSMSRGKLKFVHHDKQQNSYLPSDSMMLLYLALDTGKLWVPAQVYNRENHHPGFSLSCYDAEVCYDSKTDTFQARYPPHGKWEAAIESGVTWDRLRSPPADTPPHDSLQDLRPGDSIEIQWRMNKEVPYGWWYGVIGHLESCAGNASFCLCHSSDDVVVEFNHYAQGSHWRYITLDRKNQREEGNEEDGFYGGVRKLRNEKEITTWKQFWPTDVLG